MSEHYTRDPNFGKLIGFVLGIAVIAIAGFFGTESLPIWDTSVSVLLFGIGGLGAGIGLLLRRFRDTP